MSSSVTGRIFDVISRSTSAGRPIPSAFAAPSISVVATSSSSAARRAWYKATPSLTLPKLAAGCCSALSSTSASVIEADPTVATTSVGAGRLDCCAAVGEQSVSSAMTQAPQGREIRIRPVYPWCYGARCYGATCAGARVLWCQVDTCELHLSPQHPATLNQ